MKFSFICSVFFFTLSACSSHDHRKSTANSSSTLNQTIIEGNFQQAWNKVVNALDYYSIVSASKEKGYLQTEWLLASNNPYVFQASASERSPSSVSATQWGSHKSQIEIHLLRIDDNRTQVMVTKTLLAFNPIRGVFEPSLSNGEEEALLLQMIRR